MNGRNWGKSATDHPGGGLLRSGLGHRLNSGGRADIGVGTRMPVTCSGIDWSRGRDCHICSCILRVKGGSGGGGGGGGRQGSTAPGSVLHSSNSFT